MARDRYDRGDTTFVVTPNQVVDMADARIAQLKADLRLTPDQDKNWGGLQTALHDMAQRRADLMNRMREQRSVQSNDQPANTTNPPATAPATADNNGNRTPDAIADMRRQADLLAAKADDLRKFADASGPLYGSLNDSQKDRFMMFAQRNLLSDNDSGGGYAPDDRRGRHRW
jgi:hypothetical protein